jgi:uncharacterized NAD(P)/FAD-binding protein YdhS
MRPNLPHIAVIGTGFCGMMTAWHLLTQSNGHIQLTLIGDGAGVGLGAAYGTTSPKHLLNVPAGKMTALPDQPHHFLEWLHQRSPYDRLDMELLGRMYVPRADFGRYLTQLWQDAVASYPQAVIQSIHTRATAMQQVDSGYIISAGVEVLVTADYVVLATGNDAPANPRLADDTFYQSALYYPNPWTATATSGISPDEDVLIIGNGLTMVDSVLSLLEHGCRGTIYSLSPHGFSILPHRHNGMVYTKLVEELPEQVRLVDLFRLLKKHSRIVRQFGLSAEPVVDSLRPLSQQIWKGFTLAEKKAFLLHLRHLWGVARHRLPTHIYDQMQQMRIQRKLQVIKGSLLNIQSQGDKALVTYTDKSTKQDSHITVSRVINCTGPQLDISRSSNPLTSSLAAQGMIRPDQLHLGIDTTDTGAIIAGDGQVSDTLFTLGGNLRGLLWETTAIPELRLQAKHLAARIIHHASCAVIG